MLLAHSGRVRPALAWSPAGPLVLAFENGVRNQDLGAGVLREQSGTRSVSRLTKQGNRVHATRAVASKLLDKSLCATENRLAESKGPAGPFGQNEYSTAVVFF